MSKHHPQRQSAVPFADVKARIERTRREGRFQQALELVKQLHKHEPTPENLEILKDTYFARARQLRGQGAGRDAATVLEVAGRLDDRNPAWLRQLAGEMALCGDAARLQALLGRLTQLPGATPADAEVNRPLLTALADAALLQEKNGRASLPADLQADHDRIVKAFREVEAGQDDAARGTLQGVGLRSPFLEWKILLRGLQAYYVREDDRARENWQRLDPARLPARLAAPFRAAIDPEYSRAQPPAVQARLRQQLEGTQGGDLRSSLRDLRKALDDRESLAAALTLAERLLPTLRQRAPHVVSRLAGHFYWAVLQTGPNDLARFRRVFGAPPDDPHLNRLNALGHELGGDLEAAHRYWQAFEGELAGRPDLWPGEQGLLARALVWTRMGDNAARVPTAAQFKKLPRFLRNLEEAPRPLSPPAGECFRRAAELVPTLVEAHAGLFQSLIRDGQEARALKVGEQMLERFPDDVEATRRVGTLLLNIQKYPRAREVWERAVRLQPLDRQARAALGQAHLGLARDLVRGGKYDQARLSYRAGFDLMGPESHPSTLCRWAVAEMVAGDSARADELLAQARGLVGEVYVSYHLLVEAHRMGLPSAARARYGKGFAARLEGPVDPASAVALLEYATTLAPSGVTYTGQKGHLKKIVAAAGKLDADALDEALLRRLLAALLENEGVGRVVPRLCRLGRQRFPDSPHFPYFEAVHLMGDDPDETLRDWKVRRPLEEAARLARQRPADEPGVKDLLADVERRQALLRALNPFADMMSHMFGGHDEDDF